MSKDDKIEDLFRSKIKNDAAGEDWSTPPDAPWQNAQGIVNAEIEAKKKKRRFFFIIPFGISMLLIAVWLLLPLIKSPVANLNLNNIASSSSVVTPKTPEAEQATYKSSAEKQEYKNEGDPSDDAVRALTNDGQGSEIRKKNSTRNEKVNENRNVVGQESTKIDLGTTRNNNSQNVLDQGVGSELADLVKYNPIVGPVIQQSEEEQEVISVLDENIPVLSSNGLERDGYSVKLLPLLTINLEVDNSNILKLDQNLTLTTQETTPIRAPFKRFEIGLGSASYVAGPLNSWKPEAFDEQVDKLQVNYSYFNANLYLSRRWNRRWGFTSGVYYTYQKLDMEYTISQPYNAADQENRLESYIDIENPGNNFGLINTRASSRQSIFIIGEEATINFFSDADLVEGDQLEINGRVPARIDIVTVPFHVDYHWYYRKFEYYVFSGVSLNYLRFSLKELPITIYKDTQLVADEVISEPITAQLVLPNYMLGGGIKYHIDEKWNASIAYNLNPIAISFSKIYLGVNYRF